jgi:hypothetical protein
MDDVEGLAAKGVNAIIVFPDAGPAIELFARRAP